MTQDKQSWPSINGGGGRVSGRSPLAAGARSGLSTSLSSRQPVQAFAPPAHHFCNHLLLLQIASRRRRNGKTPFNRRAGPALAPGGVHAGAAGGATVCVGRGSDPPPHVAVSAGRP